MKNRNVVIDPDRCTGCGVCTKDCFSGKLLLEDGRVVPQSPCNGCGHCVAICPQGAASIPEYPLPGPDFLSDGPGVSPEALLELIRRRRSIRQYRAQAVEPETVAEILEAGRYSATGGNRQDVAYVAVREAFPALRTEIWESLGRMAEQGDRPYAAKWQQMYCAWKADPADDRLFFGAPMLLVVLSGRLFEAGMAAQSIELAACANKLGVLYSGFIVDALRESERALRMLGIPDGGQVAIAMLLGYPAVHYRRAAPRRPVEVHWL